MITTKREDSGVQVSNKQKHRSDRRIDELKRNHSLIGQLFFPSLPLHYPLSKKIHIVKHNSQCGAYYISLIDMIAVILCFTLFIAGNVHSFLAVRVIFTMETFLIFVLFVDAVISYFISRSQANFQHTFLDIVTVFPTFFILIYVIAAKKSLNYFEYECLSILKLVRVLRLFRTLHLFKVRFQRIVFKLVLTFASILFIASGFLRMFENTMPQRDLECQHIGEDTEWQPSCSEVAPASEMTYCDCEENNCEFLYDITDTDGHPTLIRCTPNISFYGCLHFIIITVSLVGYGSTSSSIFSKGLVVVLIFIALLTLPGQFTDIEHLVNSRSHFSKAYSPSLSQHCDGHVIVCGHVNDRQKLGAFLQEFLHPDRMFSNSIQFHVVILHPCEPSSDIVEMITSFHFYQRVTYVVGSSLVVADLKRARANDALGMFFLCNTEITEETAMQEDVSTVTRCLSASNFTPDLSCFVQVLQPEEKEILKDSGVEVIMCLDEFKTSLMAKNVVCPGISTFIENLFHSFGGLSVAQEATLAPWHQEYIHGVHMEMYFIHLHSSFLALVGFDFQAVCDIFFQAFETVVVGVASEDQTAVIFNPTPREMKTDHDDKKSFFETYNYAVVFADSNLDAEKIRHAISLPDSYGGMMELVGERSSADSRCKRMPYISRYIDKQYEAEKVSDEESEEKQTSSRDHFDGKDGNDSCSDEWSDLNSDSGEEEENEDEYIGFTQAIRLDRKTQRQTLLHSGRSTSCLPSRVHIATDKFVVHSQVKPPHATSCEVTKLYEKEKKLTSVAHMPVEGGQNDSQTTLKENISLKMSTMLPLIAGEEEFCTETPNDRIDDGEKEHDLKDISSVLKGPAASFIKNLKRRTAVSPDPSAPRTEVISWDTTARSLRLLSKATNPSTQEIETDVAVVSKDSSSPPPLSGPPLAILSSPPASRRSLRKISGRSLTSPESILEDGGIAKGLLGVDSSQRCGVRLRSQSEDFPYHSRASNCSPTLNPLEENDKISSTTTPNRRRSRSTHVEMKPSSRLRAKKSPARKNFKLAATVSRVIPSPSNFTLYGTPISGPDFSRHSAGQSLEAGGGSYLEVNVATKPTPSATSTEGEEEDYDVDDDGDDDDDDEEAVSWRNRSDGYADGSICAEYEYVCGDGGDDGDDHPLSDNTDEEEGRDYFDMVKSSPTPPVITRGPSITDVRATEKKLDLRRWRIQRMTLIKLGYSDDEDDDSSVFSSDADEEDGVQEEVAEGGGNPSGVISDALHLTGHIIVFGCSPDNLLVFIAELRNPQIMGSYYHPIVIVDAAPPSHWQSIKETYNDIYFMRGDLTRSKFFNRINMDESFACVLMHNRESFLSGSNSEVEENVDTKTIISYLKIEHYVPPRVSFSVELICKENVHVLNSTLMQRAGGIVESLRGNNRNDKFAFELLTHQVADEKKGEEVFKSKMSFYAQMLRDSDEAVPSSGASNYNIPVISEEEEEEQQIDEGESGGNPILDDDESQPGRTRGTHLAGSANGGFTSLGHRGTRARGNYNTSPPSLSQVISFSSPRGASMASSGADVMPVTSAPQLWHGAGAVPSSPVVRRRSFANHHINAGRTTALFASVTAARTLSYQEHDNISRKKGLLHMNRRTVSHKNKLMVVNELGQKESVSAFSSAFHSLYRDDDSKEGENDMSFSQGDNHTDGDCTGTMCGYLSTCCSRVDWSCGRWRGSWWGMDWCWGDSKHIVKPSYQSTEAEAEAEVKAASGGESEDYIPPSLLYLQSKSREKMIFALGVNDSNSFWDASATHYILPVFASGRAYVPSSFESLLVQSFFSGLAPRICERFVCGQNNQAVMQVAIPECFWNKTFTDLHRFFLTFRIVCLGLYRAPQQRLGSLFPYLYLSPPGCAELYASDKAFVFGSYARLNAALGRVQDGSL